MKNKISDLYLGTAIVLFTVSLTLIFIRDGSELKGLVLDGLAKVLFKQKVIYYKGPFLRNELGEVEKVKVVYYGNKQGKLQDSAGAVIVLALEKDGDLISKLYKKVASIKRLRVFSDYNENESQESEPLFEIKFIYKNGESDLIVSNETGRYIYRRFGPFGSGGAGWYCNGNMLALIKGLQ